MSLEQWEGHAHDMHPIFPWVNMQGQLDGQVDPMSGAWKRAKGLGKIPTQMQNYTPKFRLAHLTNIFKNSYSCINWPNTRPIDPMAMLGFFSVDFPGPERVAFCIQPSAPAPAFPFGHRRIWSSAARRPIAIPWRPARRV